MMRAWWRGKQGLVLSVSGLLQPPKIAPFFAVSLELF